MQKNRISSTYRISTLLNKLILKLQASKRKKEKITKYGNLWFQILCKFLFSDSIQLPKKLSSKIWIQSSKSDEIYGDIYIEILFNCLRNFMQSFCINDTIDTNIVELKNTLNNIFLHILIFYSYSISQVTRNSILNLICGLNLCASQIYDMNKFENLHFNISIRCRTLNWILNSISCASYIRNWKK